MYSLQVCKIKVLDVKFILCKFQVKWFRIKNNWAQFVPVGLQFLEFWLTKQAFGQFGEENNRKTKGNPTEKLKIENLENQVLQSKTYSNLCVMD